MEYLDPLDQGDKQNEKWEYFEEQREGFSDKFYLLIFIGFIVLCSIKVYQTWPSHIDQQINTIQNRRAAILEEAKDIQDTDQIQQLSTEYDSLTRILQGLIPQEEN